MSSKKLSNLSTRILVAAIYFPLLLISVVSESLFALFAYLVLSCAWHEYLCFESKPASRFEWIKHICLALVLGTPVLLLDGDFPSYLPFVLLGVALQSLFLFRLFKGRDFADIWGSLQFFVFGLLYLTGLMTSLVLLHRVEDGGQEAIWFLIFVVAATDTGAYFAGKNFGRTPFFEWISPSKTWEGVAGGLLAAAAISIPFFFVYREVDLVTPPLMICVILAFVVGICSVLGDLMESQLKRCHGVKDSGKILGGHGGVLDRFDGLMFAALPLLMIVTLSGGFSFDSLADLWQILEK